MTRTDIRERGSNFIPGYKSDLNERSATYHEQPTLDLPTA